MIVTDDWLQEVGDWSGPPIDTSNLKSINEVLRNTASIDAATYESGFIDRLNVHNLYMRSNLGGFSTIGPRGENNIIKKYQSQTILDMPFMIVLLLHMIT